MGCCSSKENERENIQGTNTGQNRNTSSNTRTSSNQNQRKVGNDNPNSKDVWGDVKPLEAPYPTGNQDMNQVIKPTDLAIDDIFDPEFNVQPKEKVGVWQKVSY